MEGVRRTSPERLLDWHALGGGADWHGASRTGGHIINSHILTGCGGVCRVLRHVLFTAVLWGPIAIMAWWAWGYHWWYGPWMSYIRAEALTPQIAPGEQLVVEWEYEIYLDCPRLVELWLDDAGGLGETLIWSHRGKTRGVPPGRRKVVSDKLPLPPLKPGMYTLESIATAECTPLHSETIRSPNGKVTFEVVPKGG